MRDGGSLARGVEMGRGPTQSRDRRVFVFARKGCVVLLNHHHSITMRCFMDLTPRKSRAYNHNSLLHGARVGRRQRDETKQNKQIKLKPRINKNEPRYVRNSIALLIHVRGMFAACTPAQPSPQSKNAASNTGLPQADSANRPPAQTCRSYLPRYPFIPTQGGVLGSVETDMQIGR